MGCQKTLSVKLWRAVQAVPISLPVSCGQLRLHLAGYALPTSGEGLDLGGLCKDLGFYSKKDGRAVILRV